MKVETKVIVISYMLVVLFVFYYVIFSETVSTTCRSVVYDNRKTISNSYKTIALTGLSADEEKQKCCQVKHFGQVKPMNQSNK